MRVVFSVTLGTGSSIYVSASFGGDVTIQKAPPGPEGYTPSQSGVPSGGVMSDLPAPAISFACALAVNATQKMTLADGTEIWAQLTRPELQRLELREGQIAYLRPIQTKSFR